MKIGIYGKMLALSLLGQVVILLLLLAVARWALVPSLCTMWSFSVPMGFLGWTWSEKEDS